MLINLNRHPLRTDFPLRGYLSRQRRVPAQPGPPIRQSNAVSSVAVKSPTDARRPVRLDFPSNPNLQTASHWLGFSGSGD